MSMPLPRGLRAEVSGEGWCSTSQSACLLACPHVSGGEGQRQKGRTQGMQLGAAAGAGGEDAKGVEETYLPSCDPSARPREIVCMLRSCALSARSRTHWSKTISS
eukprot:763724-Hanusia_phi.AAC.10